MTLDPYLAGRLHHLEGLGDRAMARSDPEAARSFAEYHRDPAEWRMPDVSVEDRAVPGPHGEVPVRIYRPREQSGRALLWLHGGGFMAGTWTCRRRTPSVRSWPPAHRPWSSPSATASP
ncbi:hypothetical protein HFP72_29260 [Nocardiopsis sp. ARC36]